MSRARPPGSVRLTILAATSCVRRQINRSPGKVGCGEANEAACAKGEASSEWGCARAKVKTE